VVAQDAAARIEGARRRLVVELGRLAVLRIGLGQGLIALGRRAGRTEGRVFYGLAAEEYVRQTESAANEPAVAEQLLHFLGQRIGGDVEVLRRESEQQVAHAAAHEERRVASLLQPVQHPQ